MAIYVGTDPKTGKRKTYRKRRRKKLTRAQLIAARKRRAAKKKLRPQRSLAGRTRVADKRKNRSASIKKSKAKRARVADKFKNRSKSLRKNAKKRKKTIKGALPGPGERPGEVRKAAKRHKRRKRNKKKKKNVKSSTPTSYYTRSTSGGGGGAKSRSRKSTKKKPVKRRVKRQPTKKRNMPAKKKKKTKKKKRKLSPKRKYPTSLSKSQREKLLKEAGQVSREQYLPALHEINRQMRNIERERDRAVGTQTAFGQTGDAALADAAQWLDQVLSRQAGVTQDIYSNAASNVEGAYAGALAANERASDTVRGDLQQQAEALGISEALDDPEAELKAEILAAQAETEGDYAEAIGNLETLGAGESARAQEVVGTAARQSVQDRSDLQAQIAANIGALEYQAGSELAEGRYARRDLQQQRGLSTKNLYRDLRRETQDRQRQKWADLLYQDVQRNTMRLQNAQLGLEKTTQKFNRKISRGQLQLAKRTQRQGQQLQNRQFKFNKSLALKQLRNEKARLRAEIAAANSPAARAQLRLELQKTQADINYTNARTARQLAEAASARKKKKRPNWQSRLATKRGPTWMDPGSRPGGR